MNYNYIEGGRVPIYAWTKGVPVDENALQQVKNISTLPFAFKHVALMPDVHYGIGATVGSVIATKGAIVPAAVGVDIGCGMVAAKLSLTIDQLPDDLHELRTAIETAVPHGRTDNGGPGDRGAWYDVPEQIARTALDMRLDTRWLRLKERHPGALAREGTGERQLCTLGTGNHFIEVCTGSDGHVWIMLHSGSRGVGNRIGTYFITKAKEQAEQYGYAAYLPDLDLAWLAENTPLFGDYIDGMSWAQDYAATNRELMLWRVLDALHPLLPGFYIKDGIINCHHNYAAKENHFGSNVWVTRKGAVRARNGDLGIIPGAMGKCSFIVRGLGNAESFNSCSHGAGRVMSRGEARRNISLETHNADLAGVECRRDADVLDESPRAYKNVEDVMRAQSSLVEPVVTLKGVIVVKG